MVAPAGTPKRVLSLPNGALGRILRQSDLNAAFIKESADPAYTTQAQFRASIEEEVAKWRRVIK